MRIKKNPEYLWRAFIVALYIIQGGWASYAVGGSDNFMFDDFKCERSSSPGEDEETRAFLGIQVNHCVENGQTGVYVVGFYGLMPERVSPASKAGIEEGDQLISLSGCKIKNASNVINAIKRAAPGSGLYIQVRKRGQSTNTTFIVKTLSYSPSVDAQKKFDIPLEKKCYKINLEQGKYYP